MVCVLECIRYVLISKLNFVIFFIKKQLQNLKLTFIKFMDFLNVFVKYKNKTINVIKKTNSTGNNV